MLHAIVMGWMLLTVVAQEANVDPEHWLQKSAARGHAPAAFSLGKMYWNGESGSRDVDRACQWTLVAGVLAKRGGWDPLRPGEAAEVRRELPEQISRIRETLTTDELTECVLKAEAWLAANPARHWK